MKSYCTLLIFFYCLSINCQEWIRQNPFPQFSFIHNIAMDESGHGWAVGGESIILHTPDYGNSWFSQDAPIPGWVIQGVAIKPNSNNQTILAGGNSFLKTTDGGETWNIAGSDGNISAIKHIQFINENDVFAIGFTQAGFSNDAGSNWTVMPSKPDINVISAGYFKDVDNGFVVGPGPDSKIYRTTDGAQNWNLVDENETIQFPVGMYFLTDQIGYIFGRDFLYKTTDGGNNWEQTHQNLIEGSVNGGAVVNENLIYLAANNGGVHRSDDGGANFTEIRPNLHASRFNKVAADSNNRIWLASQFTSIIFSNNGGQDWTDQVGGNKEILRDVDFKDNMLGLAVGNEGTILRTDDGGAIWEDISIDPSNNFFGMHFKDEENIWLCGSQGKIYKGNSNATNFSQVSQIGVSGLEIFARTNSDIFVADEDGNLYRSMNSGSSWSSVYHSNRRMSSVHFYNDQVGYAASENGELLTTTDGGNTWNETIADNSREFVDIFPTSEQEVWALEYRGDSIWHSTNQGMNWEQINLSASTFWTEISFMNQDTGWICGGSSGFGVVYKTLDGGQTWAWDHSSNGALNGMVAPVEGEDLAWAVGHGGNIIKFSQCNFTPAISHIEGEEMPCEGDTVLFQIDQEYVTQFEWDFPGSWLILGNPNSARVEVVAGFQSGLVLVKGVSDCGESETLEYFVNPSPVNDAVIELQGDDLVCLTNGVSYQWYTNQGSIIGATSSSFTPTETGTYFVRVIFDGGCISKASNVITVTISGVENLAEAGFSVYPNPSTGSLFIDVDSQIHSVKLEFSIWDIHGHNLLNQKLSLSPGQKIDLNNITDGLYFMMIQTDSENYTDKLMIVR